MEPELDTAIQARQDLWRGLEGARIFITGGTGFLGAWLLEAFHRANKRYGLGARVDILSRDRTSFERRHPALCGDSVGFVEGDIKDFAFPSAGYTHVIHAAAEYSESGAPEAIMDTIVVGTRRILELSARSGAGRRLLVSSGAVYGRQPSNLKQMGENHPLPSKRRPVTAVDAYAEGKRRAEELFRESALGTEAMIARCFSFLGPYMPLDSGFAAGNFIRDAVTGSPIRVNGDGSPFRSYLYASDAACWLWAILLSGTHGQCYNVGSEKELDIRTLAESTATILGCGKDSVRISRPRSASPAERYVPSTARARRELGVSEAVELESAIRRTGEWARRSLSQGAFPT